VLRRLLLDDKVERWLNEGRGDRRVQLREVGHELFLTAGSVRLRRD
jgi:hypothetical protein